MAMPKGKRAMTPKAFKALRTAAKLTQAEAAERLSVHVGTIRSWEQGIRGISPAMAKLAKSVLAK